MFSSHVFLDFLATLCQYGIILNRRDGNPFNTTAAPLPSPPAPSVLPSPPAPSVLPSPPDPSVLPSPPDPSVLPSPITQEAPTQSPARSGSSASSNTTSPNSSTTSSSGQTPGNHTVSPPMQSPPTQQVQKTQSAKTRRIVGISIASVIGFIILVLALLLCLPWCFRRSRAYYRATTRHEIRPYMGARESSHINGSSRYSNNQVEKGQPSLVNSLSASLNDYEHNVPIELQVIVHTDEMLNFAFSSKRCSC